MTAQKDLKKIIRARQQKTGESYTTARAHVLRDRPDAPTVNGTAPGSDHYASVPAPHEIHRIWLRQCEATLGIRERFGLQSALAYLVGEKLIMFMQASETRPEFAAELPLFVAWIRRNFETGELKGYLGTIQRTGISARLSPHGEVILRRRGPESRDPRNSIDRDLMRLNRAVEMILDQVNLSSKPSVPKASPVSRPRVGKAASETEEMVRVCVSQDEHAALLKCRLMDDLLMDMIEEAKSTEDGFEFSGERSLVEELADWVAGEANREAEKKRGSRRGELLDDACNAIEESLRETSDGPSGPRQGARLNLNDLPRRAGTPMRLYRGLKERFRPGAVARGLNGADFTDCPWTALTYARGAKGVLLVVDIPEEDAPRVTEELWLRSGPKRLMVWGRFGDCVTAEITAKSLRAYIKSSRLLTASDATKGRYLADYLDRLINDHGEGRLSADRAATLLARPDDAPANSGRAP